MSMTDEAFLRAFEECTLPKTEFRHQGHLRICFMYLGKYDFDTAMQRVCEGIIRFATSLGALHIFHLTLTCAWVHIVAKAMQGNKQTSFAAFIEASNYLLDKDLPKRYYSEQVLSSELARKEWIEPDLARF